MQDEQQFDIGAVHDSWESLKGQYSMQQLQEIKLVLVKMFWETLNEINNELKLDFDEQSLIQAMIENFLQYEGLDNQGKRNFIKYILSIYSSTLTPEGRDLLADMMLQENIFGRIIADQNTGGIDQLIEHPLFKQTVAKVEDKYKDEQPQDNASLQERIDYTKNVLNTFTDLMFYTKPE